MDQNPYIKPKLNIDKFSFYFLVSCLAAITVLMIFWVLIPFVYGSKFIETSLSDEEKAQIAKQVTITKIVSYIANSLALICFLIYIVLLRHKLKAGYGFLIIWILVFALLGALPWFRGTRVLLKQEIIIGVFITIFCVIILSYLIFLTVKLHLARRMHHYEWYTLNKGHLIWKN
ncbi:Uncharacterised protein (plasmid) [Mesomycoplasma conjunctivae]|nr:hypothetical protein [Mycoplasmopsis fermentans]ADV34711.1 Hypothetical Protein MfeM64YM_0713 [Mycoplasmopsis fermentans M64]VEU63823.1 Uncharacterised protein [Mycoplasmopsis fermentans]VEU67186.1 Uncharacterised protein [Mesomycoplasma conjunctivae]